MTHPPDDLRKLVERLRDSCVGHPYARIPWPHRVLHDAVDALERLLAENAALREDKERIEWLQHQSELGRDWIDFDEWDPDEQHIRAAIDATRREEKP